MDKSDLPTGKRFSHVYLTGRPNLPDSQRMRVRLLKAFRVGYREDFGDKLEQELGILLPRISYYPGWEAFFTSGELRDVLDAITLAYKYAFYDVLPNSPGIWKLAVERIFKEEKVRYCLDSDCGVHLTIDSEYERSITAAVAGLGGTRYLAAKNVFERAQTALNPSEPDFKEALRNVFEAVEVVFKLILPDTKRISGKGIEGKLKPLMASVYPDSLTAVTVAGQYLDSMCDWANSVHNYRHGQPLEEAPQPPLDISVALMSSGVAYLRWLIGVDQALLSQQK